MLLDSHVWSWAQSVRRKMRILPLVAATYFMVSGGPYGIEDILGGAGFARAILILLVLPFLWSLPTALMIGELASAIPAEGGFYIWVRRALGPFWGYQEGWLSLSASIFDMAIYPAIFVLYLGKFSPALTAGWQRLRVVAGGRRSVLRVESARRAGRRRGLVSACSSLLLAPFAVFVVLGLLARRRAASRNPVGAASLRVCAFDGRAGRAVELHGLGQRLHRRAGSRKSAAQLSARHDRRRALVARHLRVPAAGDGVSGVFRDRLLDRRLDGRGANHRRSAARDWPS